MIKITKEKIKEFEKHLLIKEKSKATIEKYLHDITSLFDWLDGLEIDKTVLLKYKEVLTENYAPASVNSHISSINSFLDFLDRRDLKIKALKIQKKIFAAKENELTKAEYERLLKAAAV